MVAGLSRCDGAACLAVNSGLAQPFDAPAVAVSAADEFVGFFVADFSLLALRGRVALEQFIVGVVGDRSDRRSTTSEFGRGR